MSLDAWIDVTDALLAAYPDDPATVALALLDAEGDVQGVEQ